MYLCLCRWHLDLSQSLLPVRGVLQHLLENQFCCKAEKCNFHTELTRFFGNVISPSTVQIDDSKDSKEMSSFGLDWPVPTSASWCFPASTGASSGSTPPLPADFSCFPLILLITFPCHPSLGLNPWTFCGVWFLLWDYWRVLEKLFLCPDLLTLVSITGFYFQIIFLIFELASQLPLIWVFIFPRLLHL